MLRRSLSLQGLSSKKAKIRARFEISLVEIGEVPKKLTDASASKGEQLCIKWKCGSTTGKKKRPSSAFYFSFR